VVRRWFETAHGSETLMAHPRTAKKRLLPRQRDTSAGKASAAALDEQPQRGGGSA
jgi:hypothetical protein